MLRGSAVQHSYRDAPVFIWFKQVAYLRCHVQGCPDDGLCIASACEGLGHTEVTELHHVARTAEDICRLEISVHDCSFMNSLVDRHGDVTVGARGVSGDAAAPIASGMAHIK